VTAVSEAARGPITFGVLLATVMGAIDTTVVNVALPHMQGSLSASPEQITWVVTSYIVAVAVVTPVSGWLAARLGLKIMLLGTVAGFTIVSALCGMAANLPEMVILRILQGVMAAPLGPLCQSVLFNINPPERYGRAMALFTMGAVAAPIVGPVLGGYLTEDLSWRWCFYINIPTGIGSMLLLWFFLPSEETQRRRFDFLGFGSLAVGIGGLQMMLDRGPSQDWFGSHEIWVEAVLAVAGFWVYLTHTLTAEHPLFDPSLARNRNFVTATVLGFFFMMLMYSSLVLLPLMMQGLMGYPVILSGIVSSPRGIMVLCVLTIMGRLDTLVDRRILLSAGWLSLLTGFWLMGHFDLSMTSHQIIFATIIQGLGQGIIFVPLATLAFATITPALRPEASSINNLMRNLGGSVGISFVQALTTFNAQRMHASLAAHIRPDDPVLRATLPSFWSLNTPQGALALNDEITRQATMVAYVDAFRLLTLVGALCLPLVFLMRQPRRGPAAGVQVIEAH
jgi:DHA2 family multidrug resistance protein